MSLFQFVWRNILYKKVLSVLSIVSVSVGVALVIFITLAHDSMEEGAAKGYGPYELVIGAEGSSTQLALNTFYHIGAPTGNISYEVYEQVKESDLAEVVYPLTKGDHYQGHQIVGVPVEYLASRYPHVSLAEGSLYQQTGEVVIGSQIAKDLELRVGDKFYGSHGQVSAHSDDHHQELLYRVVGILPPLHTPDDKAIFTTVDHAWVVHHQEEESDREKEVTALVVIPKGLMELQTLKNFANEMDGVQGVYSSKAMADVLNIVDYGTKAIQVITSICIFIAAISLMLSLIVTTTDKKKDIGLLRLIGKPKWYIWGSVVLEGQILTIIGCLFGMLLGHLTSFLLNDLFISYIGIPLQTGSIRSFDGYILLSAMIIGFLASIWPALRSYQVHPLTLFR